MKDIDMGLVGDRAWWDIPLPLALPVVVIWCGLKQDMYQARENVRRAENCIW